MLTPQLHDSRFIRWFCLAIGVVALLLGIIGIALPLLPTTPFILLATLCFMRSSETLHRKMVQHPTFGPIIHDWHHHRAMKRPVKRFAYALVTISFALSISIVPEGWHKLMLLVIAAILLLFLWRVPVQPDPPD